MLFLFYSFLFFSLSPSLSLKYIQHMHTHTMKLWITFVQKILLFPSGFIKYVAIKIDYIGICHILVQTYARNIISYIFSHCDDIKMFKVFLRWFLFMALMLLRKHRDLGSRTTAVSQREQLECTQCLLCPLHIQSLCNISYLSSSPGENKMEKSG